MKAAQPPSVTIRQIEFELEKAEHGMGLPYDAERVMQFCICSIKTLSNMVFTRPKRLRGVDRFRG